MSDNKSQIERIEQTNVIRLCNPKGKTLNLDFNGNCLVVSGDLDMDEAAEIFFSGLGTFFEKRLEEERERVRKDVQ